MATKYKYKYQVFLFFKYKYKYEKLLYLSTNTNTNTYLTPALPVQWMWHAPQHHMRYKYNWATYDNYVGLSSRR